MMNRVLRLVQAEVVKLVAHPFFLIALVVVVGATVAGGLLLDDRATPWRATHAITVFAGAAKVGLKLAVFVGLIFGSMLFAGEFDKGTIKILLTRPITRTDLFAAKSIVALGYSLFLAALVLTVGLALGCLVGELGPVWDTETYTSNTSYERLLEHARKAIFMSVAAVVAASFLGVFVSNTVESSGFSVAIALTLFLVADEVLLRAFRDDAVRRWFFSHYPAYAFDILRDFARGSSTRWKEIFETNLVYLTVPLGTIAAFATAGYAIFRARDITA